MFRSVIVMLLFFGVFLAGCSLKVVPQPVASGQINPKDNSLTVSKGGITVTAKNDDREMMNYNLNGTVTSFHVTLENGTESELSVPRDGFLLVDDTNRQYFPITPEKLREMVTKDSYYLIPYPYVGFYYMEDYERMYSNAATGSQQPYFYEVYPQDIYTNAFPEGTIIPKSSVSGQVYFKADLASMKGMKLLIYLKGTAKSSEPDFTFPFAVQK
jgi:hypothetical protein